MFRPILLVAFVLTAAGCHAPLPRFQPFAAAGSPRVPPPATGSYGRADTYYNSTPSSGAQSALLNDAASATAQTDASGWRTPETAIGSGVAMPATSPAIGASISRSTAASPQSAQSTTGLSGSAAQQAAFIESPSPRNLSAAGPLALNGMKVNDATQVAEPQRFLPSGDVIEISQLPRATGTTGTTGAPSIGSSSSATSAAATSAAASSTLGATPTQTLSADGWRSKYVPLSGGVATR